MLNSLKINNITLLVCHLAYMKICNCLITQNCDSKIDRGFENGDATRFVKNMVFILYICSVFVFGRRGACGMLPIHMAALNGYMDCVNRILISTSGFHLDTADDYGRTCLHAAACGG